MTARSALSTLSTLLIAAAFMLGACGTQTPADAPSDAPGPATSSQAPDAEQPDSNADSKAETVDLAFTAKTIDGTTFDGKSLAGKPALLWFWAPWCPTCAAQSPQVKELAQTYDGKVNVVGVSGLDDLAAMKSFVGQAGLDFPNLADESGVVWQRFGVTAQSTFVLLNADGAVVADGYLDPADLERQVADLAC